MTDQLNNKDMLIRLLDKVDTIHENVVVLGEEMKETKQHAKKTNGQIAKAQIEIATLKQFVVDEDNKILRYALVGMSGMFIFGSFIWIKESRDVIVEFVKAVL